MIRFLSSLLALIDRLFAYLDKEQWKQQGRQEIIKESEDVVQRQIALGEAALAVPDVVRDKRLRNRFDRAGQ